MAFDVRLLEKADAYLDRLLERHDALLDEAEDFGLKLAAYPRGLMPLAEAKKIVRELSVQAEQVNKFFFSLAGSRDVPPTLKKEYDALVEKASRASRQFSDDLKKANEAIAKHEDLLVGENFQEAFQAVRMAVLDLDPADDVDVDFTTDLEFDATPAYATGSVKLSKGGKLLYRVQVYYRAEDDLYRGMLFTANKNHNFEVTSKSGHTRLPKFVRDLVGHLYAATVADGTEVFTTRKSAPAVQPLRTPAELQTLFQEPIKKVLAKKLPSQSYSLKNWQASSVQLEVTAMVVPNAVLTHDLFKTISKTARSVFRALSAFNIRTNAGVYQVTPQNPESVYSAYIGYSQATFRTAEELDALFIKHCPEFANSLPGIDVLRARAAKLGVKVDDISRSKTAVAERIRKSVHTRSPGVLYSAKGMVTITLVWAQTRAASTDRVSKKFLQAGSTPFYNVIWDPDPKRAFQEARQEARDEYGHQQGYSGSIYNKDSYHIVQKEPLPRDRAMEIADKRIDRLDKWGHAEAIPVSQDKVLGKETVTVTVKARDEKDAIKKGSLLIKATGRIPPKVQIVVSDIKVKAVGGGSRVKDWSVTGVRKQVRAGTLDGWLFYGWSSS